MDIHLYGYNIHNWRYGGINSELRVIVQANMDLGVLYKTKITTNVYMRRSLDYNMLVSEAPRKHQGEGRTLLPLLTQLSDHGEPVLCTHVFIFHMLMCQKRWFSVRF